MRTKEPSTGLPKILHKWVQSGPPGAMISPAHTVRARAIQLLTSRRGISDHVTLALLATARMQ